MKGRVQEEEGKMRDEKCDLCDIQTRISRVMRVLHLQQTYFLLT